MYFVKILGGPGPGRNGAWLYYGQSSNMSKHMLTVAIATMRELKATGIVSYSNEDSKGQYPFKEGVMGGENDVPETST